MTETKDVLFLNELADLIDKYEARIDITDDNEPYGDHQAIVNIHVDGNTHEFWTIHPETIRASFPIKTPVEKTDWDRITTFDELLEHLKTDNTIYQPCMSLSVCDEGKSVELILDTAINFYLEWIKGEGGDIGLLRCRDTNRVVGCHLPLMNSKLAVFHHGPLKINDVFREPNGAAND